MAKRLTREQKDLLAKCNLLRRHALEHPVNFFKWVTTKDEHDEASPVKRFPVKDYVKEVLQEFHEKKDSSIFFVPKSRQIMMTWICCAYCLFVAKSVPYRLIFVQSKKEEDAANLVYNKDMNTARISFIENNLVDWLKDKVVPSYGKLEFPNGSRIIGIPEGGDMIRSYTPSLVFSDEAAFQPEFGKAYQAMLPLVKQGGMLIAASSAEQGPFEEVANVFGEAA